MRCAWQAFINLLPVWMRQEMGKYQENLQELRLRMDMPPEVVTSQGAHFLEKNVSIEDLRFCINVASRYSPWATGTAAQGYISCPGGHRIGLCGDAITTSGAMNGINLPTSLCIRIARDFPGIATKGIPMNGSILIIGKPGSGKTTLLRDLIRHRSDSGPGSISVIDERGEIFPHYQGKLCFLPGRRTDILTGCRKTQGIEMLLRCMGPSIIAVDEITAEEDCAALIHAGWCGVDLIATAHASSKKDLLERPIYKSIAQSRLFHSIVVLRPDKSWYLERMDT